MRWTQGGRSHNLEDRRSAGGGIGGRGLGIGGTIVVLALSLIFRQDLFSALGVEPSIGPTTARIPAADSVAQEEQVQFVSFVLDDVQNTWAKILPSYTPARLVLFRNSTDSGCGQAQSVMGPFYCPLDQRVYLDLGFFDELQQKFGAKGDFARAYVLAHELGHHVQHLTSTDASVRHDHETYPSAPVVLAIRLHKGKNRAYSLYRTPPFPAWCKRAVRLPIERPEPHPRAGDGKHPPLDRDDPRNVGHARDGEKNDSRQNPSRPHQWQPSDHRSPEPSDQDKQHAGDRKPSVGANQSSSRVMNDDGIPRLVRGHLPANPGDQLAEQNAHCEYR